jgi:hypothetical protein
MQNPAGAIFNDARARMVPGRLLVQDRYDLGVAAEALRVPLLWFERTGATGASEDPQAYNKAAAKKMIVWLNPTSDMYKHTEDALGQWLDSLQG